MGADCLGGLAAQRLGLHRAEAGGGAAVAAQVPGGRDSVQFRWPFTPGGANRVSLVEAQRNFRDFGACDQRDRRFVRPPSEDEPCDPEWRPINPATDSFQEWRSGSPRPWPDDRSVLCWWLPSF
ncbi:CPCC family cysteine-rich protein [Streptomyces sp. NPDC013740]|uniref:CPCC family cysteine-rich protein n=1 Tax=Streptomyces sp. NPDC013740 TaxID=3364867 RepID=UPI0036F6D6D0